MPPKAKPKPKVRPKAKAKAGAKGLARPRRVLGILRRPAGIALRRPAAAEAEDSPPASGEQSQDQVVDKFRKGEEVVLCASPWWSLAQKTRSFSSM